MKVKRKIPSPWKYFLNSGKLNSYSRTHSEFRNAQKHCVDTLSRFSELLVDEFESRPKSFFESTGCNVADYVCRAKLHNVE